MSVWNQGLTLQTTPEKVTPGCSFPGGGAAAGREMPLHFSLHSLTHSFPCLLKAEACGVPLVTGI